MRREAKKASFIKKDEFKWSSTSSHRYKVLFRGADEKTQCKYALQL